MFKRGKESAEKRGESFSFTSPMQMATDVQSKLVNYLSEGPVVVFALEGFHAVELGRKIVGNTEPRSALPGTIRGDFMHDSYPVSDKKGRSVRNIVHASGTVDEAKNEIKLWFSPNEVHSYNRDLDKHHS
jgi:nucleoside-diphosphate kinase